MDTATNKHIAIENIDIHKTSFNEYPIYFVHVYNINAFSNKVEGGNVHLVYHDMGRNKKYPKENPVLTYKFAYTIDEKQFIELENIFIEEAYRGKGLGSMLLKYFESKIIPKYFKDASYVRGVLLIGSENKLKRFYKRNGYEIGDAYIRKQICVFNDN